MSERQIKTRDEYYEELKSVINSVNKKAILIIRGDQNAKTGKGHTEVIGRYGKGEMNSNRRTLVEMCMRNQIVLTNTTFKHKMAHRTT